MCALSSLTGFFNTAGTNQATGLQMIGTTVLIGTRKMVMGKIGALIETEAHVVGTGMEVEGQLVMREEVTGVGLILMTALTGVGGHLPLTATNVCLFLIRNL